MRMRVYALGVVVGWCVARGEAALHLPITHPPTDAQLARELGHFSLPMSNYVHVSASVGIFVSISAVLSMIMLLCSVRHVCLSLSLSLTLMCTMFVVLISYSHNINIYI